MERPGWPGLRPQASGNGYEGQDGGRECAEVREAGPGTPFFPCWARGAETARGSHPSP